MNILIKLKILILILIIKLSFINNSLSIENKIILKIEDEIITSLDIIYEIQYLSALSPSIKSLEKERIYKIAKNSLIKEKVKEVEILKYTKDINLNQEFLQKLIKDRYSRLGLNDKSEFLNYLKDYDVNIEVIENKISIEALWNQLIYQKYFSKVKINEDDLKKQLLETLKKGEKKYLLSELIFQESNKENLNNKFRKIKNEIKKSGFGNAALTFSISESAELGGKLGWVKESSLNKEISKNLSTLKKGEITEPIFTVNGYMILKVDDIEIIEKKFDINKELKNLKRIKTNQQLNQYSNIYFNKIKKNININEF